MYTEKILPEGSLVYLLSHAGILTHTTEHSGQGIVWWFMWDSWRLSGVVWRREVDMWRELFEGWVALWYDECVLVALEVTLGLKGD